MTSTVRAIIVLTSILLSTAALTHADIRPALVGNGPKALVNQINTKKVAAKTPQGGIVMFECFIDEKGRPHGGATTYRGSGDFKALAAEVRDATDRSVFIPAMFNGKPIAVYFVGTAVFVNVDGTPHLRIFANQNSDDIKGMTDFIAPQLIAGTADWEAAKPDLERARVLMRSGITELSVSVDLNGSLKGMRVVSEDPPDFSFGRAALKEYSHARFTPGYRNGKPTECTFSFTQYIRVSKEPITTRLRGSLLPPTD